MRVIAKPTGVSGLKPGLVFCCVALATVFVGCNRSQPTPAVNAPKGTVTIKINTGDESQTIELSDVAEGTTLEEVMRSITEIPVSVQGSGTTAFVESIGETATSQSAGWTFKVDGQWAKQGVGKTTLNPPTTITWSYGDWDSDSQQQD